MQKRHRNREIYFKEQGITVRKYVIPIINKKIKVNKNTSVLEIGCGEGGNLMPFMEIGCERIVGIDFSKGKIENARRFFDKHSNNKKIEFICDNIYNIRHTDIGTFDVIITRDVLEHIHDQEKFMPFVKSFLKAGGKFFLGFPPWYNPFGGHQQMCESKFLSVLPYFHILPTFLYKSILKIFGETNTKIASLLEIKETGISIERFEKILQKEKYTIDERSFYLINPHYEVKFGLKPRKVWGIISSIPYLRNFFITTNYYLLSKN